MNTRHPLNLIVRAAERRLLPDSLIRLGIRRMLTRRLLELSHGAMDEQEARLGELMRRASRGPIAPQPASANRQHYEVPAEFFRLVLGPRLKYSCCYWPAGVETLGDAETAALELTCERAGIEDGMQILELGCGWGSLSLWTAERFPRSMVTAVSNSASQRRFIQSRAAAQGIRNLKVITADVNNFDPGARFDRIVSIEMFEHVRNHSLLLRRISTWLAPGGRLFVHLFCHRRFPYFFESGRPQDWMAEHFFSGGMMPSESLLPRYDRHVRVVDQWRWAGTHYARTCRVWLDRLDARRAAIHPIFEACYGPKAAAVWIQRWRMFFIACEELFAYGGGEEWYVAHYVMERPSHRLRTTVGETLRPATA